ncbi:MAG: HEPN domain-containing protein [Prevotella sp.]|nr:HEPN domain-containing protein [Prevotella sp.]
MNDKKTTRLWQEKTSSRNGSPEHLRFIDFMVPMYIKARYPEQKVAASRSLTKEICEHIITTTKELTQWIEERLPEKKPSTPCDATSK